MVLLNAGDTVLSTHTRVISHTLAASGSWPDATSQGQKLFNM